MPALSTRIAEALDAALHSGATVSPLDVIARLGWLHAGHRDVWRHRQAPSLEQALAFAPGKLVDAVRYIHNACIARGLVPVDGGATYLSSGNDRAPLRFTTSGDDVVEGMWRTHWMKPGLDRKKTAAIEKKLAKVPDLLVFIAFRENTCVECSEALEDGAFVALTRKHDVDGTLCMECAGFGHLVFLPSGDTALTRRAKAESKLAALVMQFSRSRGRNERRGILVEEEALERAEASCFADADARERKRERGAHRRAREDAAHVTAMSEAIARLFPSCPAKEAHDIARHAAERSSGRVGRSAAGRALEERAVELAVIAHVRHVHTAYDALLASGVDRSDARDQIRNDVDGVLTRWRDGGHATS